MEVGETVMGRGGGWSRVTGMPAIIMCSTDECDEVTGGVEIGPG